MTFRCATVAHGRQMRYASTSACQPCPRKPKCTRKKANRRRTRWGHEAIREEMPHRVAAQPEKVKARQSWVAHPCGTMKRGRDHGDFLTRGLAKGRGAMRLPVLVSNLKSVLHILGIEAWIAVGGESASCMRCRNLPSCLLRREGRRSCAMQGRESAHAAERQGYSSQRMKRMDMHRLVLT